MENSSTSMPMANMSGGAGQLLEVISPKLWKDLTAEEKIERVRIEIKKSLSNIYGKLCQIDDLKNDFQNHNHIDGKVMKDVKTHNGSGIAKFNNSEAEAKGEVYF